jgi:hypothetical protein
MLKKNQSILLILTNAVKKKVPHFNDKANYYACITRCNLEKISRCTTRARKDKRIVLYKNKYLCYILLLSQLDFVNFDIFSRWDSVNIA